MSVKVTYTKDKGLVSDKGSGFEVTGDTTIVGATKITGPIKRKGAGSGAGTLALIVSGSMGIEVSNNSSFVVQVPQQMGVGASPRRGPAIHVGAGLTKPSIGLGCVPGFNTLHLSASEDNAGILLDNNPDTATRFHFRKQLGDTWTNVALFTLSHDDRDGHWMELRASQTSGTKHFFRMNYTDDEICFDQSGSMGVVVGSDSCEDTAKLEVVSTTSGFLPPRLTDTQRDNISGPATGLTIYNTTTDKLNFYNGSAWRAVDDSAV